jgi:hypothetical protein
MANEGQPGSERNGAPPWKVTVVGPCAAGKSSLKARLRAAGVATRTVAQEHSHVPYLWQTGSPDVLIYLDVTLAALQRRRHPRWTRAMLDAQRQRLAHARAHAHLIVPTDDLTPDEVAARVLRFLHTFDPAAHALPPVPDLLRAFGGADPDAGGTA